MRAICPSSRLVAAGVVVLLACILSLGVAAPQDQKQSPKDAPLPEPSNKAAQNARDAQGRLVVENDKVEAVIDKMIAACDLDPRPLPAIPDNPPPHEGATISLPHVIEPPDLLIVEVLEALAGRPISGERLVRPDGKISLGFYGDVQVRGLTLDQLKVAIIKHLRRFLTDEALGLKTQSPSLEEQNHWAVIPPAESTAVFVDVTAYNSKNYYVQGDTQSVGKFPCTGGETVLDALQHAGGLMPQAEPKDIRLVRLGRNGKPSRVYKIDLEAIQEKGDVATNYQMFPGDRLVIGRNAVVTRTTELDRLAAPLQTVTGWNLQYAFMLRALQLAGGDGRDDLMKELVDFWAKELSREGDLKLDEQALRDAFFRKLRFTPAPITPDGK